MYILLLSARAPCECLHCRPRTHVSWASRARSVGHAAKSYVAMLSKTFGFLKRPKVLMLWLWCEGAPFWTGTAGNTFLLEVLRPVEAAGVQLQLGAGGKMFSSALCGSSSSKCEDSSENQMEGHRLIESKRAYKRVKLSWHIDVGVIIMCDGTVCAVGPRAMCRVLAGVGLLRGLLGLALFDDPQCGN